MRQYIIKRLLLMIPVVFGVTLLNFTLIHIVPGDVVDVMYGDTPLSDSDRAAIRAQLGLDKSPIEQYVHWIGGIARLDAGNSLWTRRPVFQEIADRLPVTIQLALMAFFIQLLIAIPVGVYSATNQDKPSDQIARLLSIVGTATPDFWVATIAIVVLSSAFGWIPPLGGVASLFKDPVTNLQQFILPALIIGTSGAGALTRLARNTLLEVVRQDYIRTAFAKGLATRRVWYVHAVRNALIPVLTQSGSSLGNLLGGTVIIENIFSLPGVGQLTLSSIQHRDIPQLELNVLMLALLFLTINLIVDLSYGWLDPRIRYS